MCNVKVNPPHDSCWYYKLPIAEFIQAREARRVKHWVTESGVLIISRCDASNTPRRHYVPFTNITPKGAKR